MVLAFLGYCAGGYLAIQIVRLVYQLVRPAKNLSSFGSWTVITGATDGIGKAIAFELAKKGQNLLLIGRNSEKLDKTKSEIAKIQSRIEIETLVIDLSLFNADLQDQYSKAIHDKNVGILINNAGLSYPYVNYFHEVDQQRLENMIYVNNLASTILMRRTIPKFLEKKKGAIVNISSAGAILPHALHVVYSATKSYLNKISADLASEYGSKGIAVQAQMPYFVVSKMSRIRRPSLTTPSAKDYAKACIKQIGYSGVISPYPVHAMIFFAFHFIPNFIMDMIVTSMHKSIKKKGDRKAAKKK